MDYDPTLVKKYYELFGEDQPLPPAHLLSTIIEMQLSGKMEEFLKKVKPVLDDIMKDVENVSGEKLNPDHPLFEIKFDEEE